jgi:hypothetical protein
VSDVERTFFRIRSIHPSSFAKENNNEEADDHFIRADPGAVQFFVVGNTDGIEAFLVNEQDYGNWQSGYTTFRYYDSGTVQKGTLDVPLLAWSTGVYYLVFENRSREKTPKGIQANFNLTYSDMWWPGKTE